MILNQDFKEFIKLLNDHKVEYLVVGGYALSYHGYSRFTQDIDFWIWIDEENAKRIISVLKDFGFTSLQLLAQDFMDNENVIQLGYPPNRIDILTAIDGVIFEDAFAKKDVFQDADIVINFIAIGDLIQNKKASGRLQDLADLEVLEKIRNKKYRD